MLQIGIVLSLTLNKKILLLIGFSLSLIYREVRALMLTVKHSEIGGLKWLSGKMGSQLMNFVSCPLPGTVCVGILMGFLIVPDPP